VISPAAIAACTPPRPRGDDDLVRTMPGDLLPDYTPVIDDSGLALASPYADEF
jgi:hypothetical protein